MTTHEDCEPFASGLDVHMAIASGCASALHFPVDRELPKKLVKRLIAVRLAEAGRGSR